MLGFIMSSLAMLTIMVVFMVVDKYINKWVKPSSPFGYLATLLSSTGIVLGLILIMVLMFGVGK